MEESRDRRESFFNEDSTVSLGVTSVVLVAFQLVVFVNSPKVYSLLAHFYRYIIDYN